MLDPPGRAGEDEGCHESHIIDGGMDVDRVLTINSLLCYINIVFFPFSYLCQRRISLEMNKYGFVLFLLSSTNALKAWQNIRSH